MSKPITPVGGGTVTTARPAAAAQPAAPTTAAKPAAAPTTALADIFAAPVHAVAGPRAPEKLSALFAAIPPGTSWKALAPAQRKALTEVMEGRLGEFEQAWGEQGLAAKREGLQGAPTERQTAAFNAFVRAVFDNQVSEHFTATRSVKNPELLTALKDLFLVKSAQARAFSEFYGGIGRDVSGNDLREIPLPSQKALEASEHLAGRALRAVKQIPEAGLSEVERSIRDRLLDKLVSLQGGSLGGFGFGGQDLITPYGRAAWASDVMLVATKAEGDVYHGRPEAYLRDLTAYFLSPDLIRVNAGTVQATLQGVLPDAVNADMVKESLGDPATDVRAKAFLLLGQWYGERLQANDSAERLGYGMTPRQQNAMFKNFEADALVPYAELRTVSQFRKQFDAYMGAQTAHYRDVTLAAVDALLGPSLSADQRAQVSAAVAQATLGTMVGAAKTALDQATGSTRASAKFQKALDAIGTIDAVPDGGAVPPAEAARIQAMWDEVKAYISTTYAGGPVDIGALLPDDVTVAAQGGSYTAQTGAITIGLGTPITAASLYGTLLHEAKHSIDYRSGMASKIEGGATEGGGLITENMVAPRFMDAKFQGDPLNAAFAKLALISSGVRLGARSEATLAVLQAKKGTDAITLAKDIGRRWGVPEGSLDALVNRAFNGLQYANYLGGAVQFGATIDWLQGQVQPRGGKVLDPFLLQASGVPTAGRDAESVAKLKAVLG